MKYIRQTRGTTCALISALNARAFYGEDLKNMGEGSPGFKKLAKRFHCINGPCLEALKMHRHLGLATSYRKAPTAKWMREQLKQGYCVQLVITTPKANLHAVLVVGATPRYFEVVNSQIFGPHHVELLTWKELCAAPANTYRKCWGKGCVIFHRSRRRAKIKS